MGFVEALNDLEQPVRSPAEKLREALDLYDDGVAIQRQNFRRSHPEAFEEELDAKLTRWLLREEPG